MTDATSKHVLGTTELTCLMPIKAGFVGEFETRTYTTRLRIALKVLHSLRVASREVAPLRVFPDIVDVIRSIHSFQFSIVGNKNLLLAVTFDGPWESYMRFVWEGLGPLLDPLLINCVDYEAHASDKGFDRFSTWVRRHQIETGLFYAASGASVDDIRYLTQLETAQLNEMSPEKFDKIAAAMVAIDAVEQAKEAAAKAPGLTHALGLKVISAFYGLRDSYPERAPDGQELPDARYLHRAARETLKTFDAATIPSALSAQFKAQLEWFNRPLAAPEPRPHRNPDFRRMQGGILPLPPSTTAVDKPKYRGAHGCLLLARVVDAKSARAFLVESLIEYVSYHGGPHADVYTNVAFTIGGMRRLGVPETELARFPKEFREGMEARAGLLGDVQSNHPTQWSLPEWNWPQGSASERGRVRLATIDIVVKLRCSGPIDVNEHAWSERHPLYQFATNLFGDPEKTGVQVMSVQPMLHYVKGDTVIDHFDFVDGISQPELKQDRDGDKRQWSNEVALGELFLGYRNDRTDLDFLPKDDPDALPGREVGSLLDNGTFLVVRKLEQNVAAFMARCGKDSGKLCADDIPAKMMGRTRDGDPITTGPRAEGKNSFTYEGDTGIGCPLHAHIRRGNPRDERVPRIMRRGMSYGPRYDPQGDDAKEDRRDRGLMFLAYNASIAEQFEVIQRWMSGGNSTRGFSGHADPFLRAGNGADAIFRFMHEGEVVRLNLGAEPFVTLKWGMYLFVPSTKALTDIASNTEPDTEAAKAQIAQGERIIASLQTDDDWSAILEDVTASHSGANAAVYAAIRARGGVLRTPGRGMVLVASEPLVEEVLGNDSVFSVCEYKDRMAKSIGDVYLGLDFSEEYVRRSEVNRLVSEIGEEEAFGIAEAETARTLEQLLATGNGRPVTIALEPFVDRVLARLSTCWFGIPNAEKESEIENKIIAGGRPAAGDETVHLPYHSLAPSRYIFSSPCPRVFVAGAGQRYGQQLRNAVTQLAKAKGVAGFPAKLAEKLWEATPDEGGAPQYDVFARTLVGFIEGFLPTVYGNFLKTMHFWIGEESLWRIQQDLRSESRSENPYARARAFIKPALKRSMQRRPVPDIVYRTATRQHQLNTETIEARERVVVLIASATQEAAAQAPHDPNVTLVFGGNRKEERHPTHACPAYDMGMGVLLGMISAMLERTTLTPTESPLSIEAVPFAAPEARIADPERVTV